MLTMPNIKALYKDLIENYPNGCYDINCKDCPFNKAKMDTPEDIMCKLMSSLTDESRNWKDFS